MVQKNDNMTPGGAAVAENLAFSSISVILKYICKSKHALFRTFGAKKVEGILDFSAKSGGHILTF